MKSVRGGARMPGPNRSRSPIACVDATQKPDSAASVAVRRPSAGSLPLCKSPDPAPQQGLLIGAAGIAWQVVEALLPSPPRTDDSLALALLLLPPLAVDSNPPV